MKLIVHGFIHQDIPSPDNQTSYYFVQKVCAPSAKLSAVKSRLNYYSPDVLKGMYYRC